MGHDGTERRRYSRSRSGFPVREDAGLGILNHVNNISSNGVLCHTAKPVPLMTKMSMSLVLPKPKRYKVECEGIVVRCEPHESGDEHYKVAILFTKLSEADRKAIETFVEQDLAEGAAED
ncbi:MAG TPA: PilZ domain-containing protein [Candidatus Hydrogenedentes bacterium]|nr:PilZ domain-containing protein [Candidatus Hydrogenedentota bacterium]HPG69800.1 PilZ domain-containing protein [Candidatus Hydrogenedentota bacterium]